jgi:hypothetical protein
LVTDRVIWESWDFCPVLHLGVPFVGSAGGCQKRCQKRTPLEVLGFHT